MHVSRRLVLGTLLLLAGCGGAGGTVTATARPTLAPKTATIHFTLSVPSKGQARQRRPSYIPASSKQLVVLVNGTAVAPITLTSGGTQTVSVSAPLGSDVFDFTILGTANKPISHTTQTINVVLNSDNATAVALLPVVASGTITSAGLTPAYGTAVSNVSLTIDPASAQDADGNAIPAPPFDPLTVNYTDPTGHLSPANGPVANGAFAYDGKCLPPTTMTVTSLAGSVATTTYASDRVEAHDAASLGAAVTTVNANGGIVAFTKTDHSNTPVVLKFNNNTLPMGICGQGADKASLSWNGSDYGAIELIAGHLFVADLTVKSSTGLSILNQGDLTMQDTELDVDLAGLETSSASAPGRTAVVLRSLILCSNPAVSIGIYQNAGTSTIIDRTTISGCRYGFESYIPAVVRKSTFVGNTTSLDALNVDISNSIVASINPDGLITSTFGSSGTDLDYNDFTNVLDISTYSGSMHGSPLHSISVDPMAGALTNNGGPTRSYLPSATAVTSVIPAAKCPTDLLDQRGYVRPAGSNCSMGSIDVNAVHP